MRYRLNPVISIAMICCLIIIQSCWHTLHALQGARTEPGEMIYMAFISEEMELWEKAMELLDHEYKLSGNINVLYELILARYGFIGYSLGIGNEQVATAQIELAERQIGDLAAYPEYESSAKAIQAALFAFRIAMAPWRALFWGRRSMNLIYSALEADPDNPQAWIEHGNAMFYAPRSLGGSKQEAIKSYGKAITLMEANMVDKHRWLYLNTLVALAKSYRETGNRQMAVRTYRKALEFEPEFTWVRDRLLPELLQE
jgi:tetratricopeptide (TPR) repeat protein